MGAFGGRLAALVAGIAMVVATAGCASGKPPAADAAPAAGSGAAVQGATAQLAARVAAARDRRYTASYAVTGNNKPARMIAVTVAQDGSWRVDIPGGALGGAADVAIASDKTGVYQCRFGTGPLPSPASPPPPSAPTALSASCVKVAGPGGAVPAAFDPRLHHPFTDWLTKLADKQLALSIDRAATLPGATGTCFSVEPTAASLTPPLDPGIYCFADDGTLTGIRAGLGTLILAGGTGPAPASAPMPGPIAAGPAAPTSPPPPSPSASASRRVH